MLDLIHVFEVEDTDFYSTKTRSSHPKVFCKKGVLKNFAKCTGKLLCESLFFNKVAGLKTATLSKRGSGTGAFL